MRSPSQGEQAERCHQSILIWTMEDVPILQSWAITNNPPQI